MSIYEEKTLVLLNSFWRTRHHPLIQRQHEKGGWGEICFTITIRPAAKWHIQVTVSPLAGKMADDKQIQTSEEQVVSGFHFMTLKNKKTNCFKSISTANVCQEVKRGLASGTLTSAQLWLTQDWSSRELWRYLLSHSLQILAVGVFLDFASATKAPPTLRLAVCF